MLIHHFVGEGWESKPAGSLEADLGFLSLVARKVDTIRDDLGTVGPVLAQEVERKMLGLPADVDRRPAERNLRDEVARLRQQLDASVEELGLTPGAVEWVVQTTLEMARQPALKPMTLRAVLHAEPGGPASSAILTLRGKTPTRVAAAAQAPARLVEGPEQGGAGSNVGNSADGDPEPRRAEEAGDQAGEGLGDHQCAGGPCRGGGRSAVSH